MLFFGQDVCCFMHRCIFWEPAVIFHVIRKGRAAVSQEGYLCVGKYAYALSCCSTLNLCQGPLDLYSDNKLDM